VALIVSLIDLPGAGDARLPAHAPLHHGAHAHPLGRLAAIVEDPAGDDATALQLEIEGTNRGAVGDRDPPAGCAGGDLTERCLDVSSAPGRQRVLTCRDLSDGVAALIVGAR
jgi:hypothetical protein